MGKILNVRENNNIVEMSIFDGTGTYTVHYYSNDVDDSVRGTKASTLVACIRLSRPCTLV